jgi:ornithine carbamoyltransferase
VVIAAKPGAMQSIPQSADPRAIDANAPNDMAALVERARALQDAADAGTTQRLLRGKRFGLLCGSDEATSDAAALFDHAAAELGAQVAHIHPRLTELSSALDVQQTAHMLGRLYDAVVCEGMASALVQRLSHEVGVPVYDHIASANHVVTRAAMLLGPPARVADNRRFVLQALLLRSTA